MVTLDIIAGFLGAGKTTLINKLLAEVYTGEKPVLIENEFGSVSIDDNLIEDSEVQVRVLASGCICCTIRGDFQRGVVEVVEQYNPSRILIEPTGLADPADIFTAVEEAGKSVPLRVNAFVTVANAETVLPLVTLCGDLFKTQIAGAKLLLLNRAARLKAETLDKTMEIIRKLNPDCILLDQDDGETTPLSILALAEEAMQGCPCCGHGHGLHEGHIHRHEHGHGHGHDHDADNCHAHEHDHAHSCHDIKHDHDHSHGSVQGAKDVSSMSFFPERAYSDKELDEIFSAFSNGNCGLVFRAKGFLKSENGGFNHVEYVYGRGEKKARDYAGKPKFVVIGLRLNKPALSGILL